MKMNTHFYIFTFLFFYNQSLFAANPNYNMLDKSYVETIGSKVENKNVTAIKSQDGIGICYAFTIASLLETFRCQEMKINCQDPHERLSTLDLASYVDDSRSLVIGGFTHLLLQRIAKSNLKIAREECAPFSALAHQLKDNKKNLSVSEEKGWNILLSKWNEFKGSKKNKSNDCVECLAKSVKSSFNQLKTSVEQIQEAFKTSQNAEEFLYKTLLPTECLSENSVATIPPFETHTYPDGLELYSDEVMLKKVEALLTNETPVELAICTDELYTPDCKKGEGHSLTLYGIKEVCSSVKNECRTMVKIRNSKGASWQNHHNDGWVELNTLLISSKSLAQNFNMTWITKPGAKMPDTELKKSPQHVDLK